jgi:hypothetical protein
MSKKDQISMFDDLDEFSEWKKEWQGMPEFIQDDDQPIQQIIVSFKTKEDVQAFSDLVKQKITYKTKSLWFPKLNEERPSNFVYTDEKKD